MAKNNDQLTEDVETMRNELQRLALSENTNSVRLENIKENVEHIEQSIGSMVNELQKLRDTMTNKIDEDKVEQNYVNNDRFEPIRNIVYGLVAGCLITILGAIMGVTINSNASTATPTVVVPNVHE